MFRFTGRAIAGVITAFYPYYVVHDTALQDTVLYTFLAVWSVLLLIQARRSPSPGRWLATGFLLASAVLTRETLVPFAAAALAWLGIAGSGPAAQKARRVLFVAAPILGLVGLWSLRNYALLGEPVLTSEFGYSLWVGNNPQTFSCYPEQHIDASESASIEALTPGERKEFDALLVDEMRLNEWCRRRAFTYLADHPAAAVCGAFRK